MLSITHSRPDSPCSRTKTLFQTDIYSNILHNIHGYLHNQSKNYTFPVHFLSRSTCSISYTISCASQHLLTILYQFMQYLLYTTNRTSNCRIFVFRNSLYLNIHKIFVLCNILASFQKTLLCYNSTL